MTKPPNAMFWTMMPGIRNSTYGIPAGIDRAAEHVAEQQHEHNRLDRERQQQLGRPRQPDQVPLGDHQRIAHQSGHAA